MSSTGLVSSSAFKSGVISFDSDVYGSGCLVMYMVFMVFKGHGFINGRQHVVVVSSARIWLSTYACHQLTRVCRHVGLNVT